MFHWASDRSLCINYVIEGGGGLATLLHRGGQENDYSVSQILGYYIRNIMSIDLTKISGLFFVNKKSLFGG